MKKLALVLLIALIVFSASSAFAAKGGGMKFGIGAVAGLRPAFWLNNMPTILPTFRLQADNFGAEFGLNFTTISCPNSINNTHFNILAKGDYVFSPGQIAPHIGGIFVFDSDSNPGLAANATSSSGFGFGGYYGATFTANPNFDITADVIPLVFSSYSAGGQSTTLMHFGLGMITSHYYF